MTEVEELETELQRWRMRVKLLESRTVMASAVLEGGADKTAAEFSLEQLQDEQYEWAFKNFGDQPGWHSLLGAVEELGELAHAHLKSEQEIRAAHFTLPEKKIDAIGDIVIYLAGYCSAEGIELSVAVEQTWNKVKQRNWKKDPEHG